MSISKLVVALRFIGLAGVARSVHYALARQWIERRVRLPSAEVTPEPPGRCLDVEIQPGGARCGFERVALEVRFLAPDLARITWDTGSLPLPYALARTHWPAVPVNVSEGPTGWALTTKAMRVEVLRDGALTFRDSDGRPLREDLPPLRRGREVVHRARSRSDEHMYGLGNRTVPLNLRGGRYHLWNTDPGAGLGPGHDPTYLCLPVYLGLHAEGSYLVFYENPYRGTLTLRDLAEARFEGGALRYYVIPGPPARALERYTELTGRPPLPPRWALGYHQSRWSYDSEAMVREIVEGFRAHDLPISAVHLDIDHMDGFRVFTADPRRFPDIAGLSRDLLDRGVRLVAILDPGVKIDGSYDIFAEGNARRVYCALPDGAPARAPVWPGWCVFPDFTDPDARAWWAALYPRLLDMGIAGVWHDMNEPAAFAAWGDGTLPLPTRHAMDGRGGSHLEAHNVYGLLENQAGFQALREHRPEARPFIVSRSGWAGVQRYAWNWTGDVEGSWRSLRQTVATVLGLGLSGIPYTGADIGGFSGSPSAELHLRWFQLAAFLPFFRTHSAKFTPRREPWCFGEQALGIMREWLGLRYRLLPYLYTLAWEATQTGHPLVRPLFWPDGGDPSLWDVQDAFFVGDALLVAPVVDEGVRAREVPLPGGAWYGFFDDRVYRAPGRVRVDAPLERIPVLVRAGSVLPLDEGRAGRGQPSITLHVYPSENGDAAGVLHSDAGDGYGPARVDRFRVYRDGGGTSRWHSRAPPALKCPTRPPSS